MTASAGTKDLERLLHLKRIVLAREQAKDSLLRYLQLQMPNPEDPENPDATLYHSSPQARILCRIMEKVEKGELQRVAVSVGPQMGKTQIISRGFPAWAAGRNPARHFILGSYNQTFAEELGNDVSAMVDSDLHKSVFPEHIQTKASASLHITNKNGKSAFVGVGGSGSGKPADFFVVDDPIKSDEEANSEVYRDRVWKWFQGIVFARARNKTGIVVVHTRWHEDDLIGRLCDPNHPERRKKYKGIAEKWTYINLPAVIEDPQLAADLDLTLEEPSDPLVIEQFGDKPMAALYPQEKNLPLLAEAKMMDPRIFEALYMGKPSREDGEFFKKEWLAEYDREELPDPTELRIYGASDHAATSKQERDYNVLGCFGVDAKDDVWILPDLVWRRMETDVTVEEMLTQFRIHKPQLWWMENELVSKSFGPFLRKRMQEERLYIGLEPITPSKDKQTRARSIQGRMAMKKVRFPRFAPWWSDAKSQMLRFPYGANDDFVDWLSYVGLGLTRVQGARFAPANDDTGDQTGSIGWIMNSALARARREKAANARKGW